MKCVVCKKGVMEKTKYLIKQNKIEFEGFRCKSCGEEIINMRQLKDLTEKYNEVKDKKMIA